MAAGDVINYESLHTSRIEQTTGWLFSTVGYTNFVFLGTGATVDVSARDYIFSKNEIGADIWGCKDLQGYTTEGFSTIKATGDQYLIGNFDWNTETWYNQWENTSGVMVGSSGTSDSTADFFATDLYTASGDEKEYRVTVCPSWCYTKEHWTNLVNSRGPLIKGRGWYTDQWWGIAKIISGFTGAEGMPFNSITPGSPSYPVFSSLPIALSYAVAWTGTHITEANKRACFPSAKTY